MKAFTLVLGAVRRSYVVAAAGLVLGVALPVRHVVAQAPVTNIADAIVASSSLYRNEPEDPPQRRPPTTGPRIPDPFIPPRRTKAYPTIDRSRMSCAQITALNTVAGTGLGVLAGTMLYIPVFLGRGDLAATRTFKTAAVVGGVLGLFGSVGEPQCKTSAN